MTLITDRPLILITNDDGIESPGLRAAAEAVAPLGDLLIAAPYHQQSGAGRSFVRMADRKIYRRSLTIAGKPVTGYSIKGSPAQVVVTAVLDLAPRPVTLAISGINFGENIGSGITASGTVGAALEAASADIPALAVSLETLPEYYLSYSEDVDFGVAAHFTSYFAQRALNDFLFPFDVDVLKIDVPATATPQTSWRVTSVSRQPYHQGLPSPPDKRGTEVEPGYVTQVDEATLEPDSDIWAVYMDKVVSVTPLSINLTSRINLPKLQEKLNGHRSFHELTAHHSG
jgi:5'-nucleotidase